MTDEPPVFRATYSDVRFVKSRKIMQIVLEIAIEEGNRFLGFFGVPTPASETWVALALLDKKEIQNPKHEKRHFSSLPLPQQAALLGDREDFWRFLRKKGYNVHSSDAAADVVRKLCHVNSRHDILEHTEAARLFREMANEFADFIV